LEPDTKYQGEGAQEMRDKRLLEERNKNRDCKERCEKQKKLGGKRCGDLGMGKKLKRSRRERQLVFGGNVKKALD